MMIMSGAPIGRFRARAWVLLATGLFGAHSLAAETRHVDLEAFDRVDFRGHGVITLLQGDEESASIHASTHDLELVDISVDRGVLHIDVDDDVDDDVRLTVRFRELVDVSMRGAARIIADGLTADTLAIEGRGAASFELQNLNADVLRVSGHGASRFSMAGSVDSQIVQLRGAGRYDGEHLASENSEISLAGAGYVVVAAEDNLDVDIAGIGRVSYVGQPHLTRSVRGLGTVGPL